MAHSSDSPRQRIPVGILGATGTVGQKFVALLAEHPWFEITALAASERSAGKPYGEAVHWRQVTALPEHIAAMNVQPCTPDLDVPLVFSALDSSIAGDIEEAFAQAGMIVVSNATNHRTRSDVPLLVPEVNSDHLALLEQQPYNRGAIVTNPNCVVAGVVVALKPLYDRFGLQSVQLTTMQAISGAGYPGVASLDILDNIIPYIKNEEDKVETEALKILGSLTDGGVQPAEITVGAQCNRVPVIDGHTACLSVKFEKSASEADVRDAWQEFHGLDGLPSAPQQPIHVFDDPFLPQPRYQRSLDGGMAVSIGRLRPCPILDMRFVALSHNTVRGAAGAAILNAELLVQKELCGLSISA